MRHEGTAPVRAELCFRSSGSGVYLLLGEDGRIGSPVTLVLLLQKRMVTMMTASFYRPVATPQQELESAHAFADLPPTPARDSW
jgi:hypothetical protein